MSATQQMAVSRQPLVEFSSLGGHNQLTVFDPLYSQNAVGQRSNLRRLAPQDHHLQAILFVHMNMHGGDDAMIMLMLKVFQAVGQFPNMMVVKKGEGPQRLLVALFPFMLHQMLPNEVSNRLGPIYESLPGDESVKLPQEVGSDGNSESNQFFHGAPLSCS